jgi:hypothetical protein
VGRVDEPEWPPENDVVARQLQSKPQELGRSLWEGRRWRSKWSMFLPVGMMNETRGLPQA